MMFCAECGTRMERREDGAWTLCCHGYGYWWSEQPLVGDRWIGRPESYKGHWLYKTVFWPNDLKAALPKLETSHDS